MTYKYSVHGHDTKYSFEAEMDENDIQALAVEAAEDYYEHHGGWGDMNWPINFVIFTENGNQLGDCVVQVNSERKFNAVN
jgi:hypothetical protein